MDLLVFYTLLLTLKYVEAKRLTFVDRLDVCYQPHDAPYIIHQFDLRIEKHRQFYLIILIEVTTLAEAKDLEANIRVTRCASREQLDTCEFFTTLRPPMNICTFISMEKIGFKQMTNMFIPPAQCPFFGNYSTKNLTYNFDTLSALPLGNKYWKMVGNLYIKKRLIMSVCFDFFMKEIRD